MSWGAPKLPAGRDDFTATQKPDVRPTDDLSRFVMGRISFEEAGPKHEVPQLYGEPAGPVAHRYAAEMRRDMAAFRRIVALYVEAVAAIGSAENEREREGQEDRALGLQQAVAAIAVRWEKHPDFRDDWR